jgi:hypothetical protein
MSIKHSLEYLFMQGRYVIKKQNNQSIDKKGFIQTPCLIINRTAALKRLTY